MSKRGQLTLFIIIGIILVFSTAVIIYLQQQVETAGFEGDQLSAFSNEVQPVKLFVDKCLADIAIPGVYYMGTQGGYITPPLEALLSQNGIIPYYYQQGINTMPSLTSLENEISEYIETTLPVCTNGFSQFSFDIEEEPIRATTRILEQKVLIKAFYPLTVIHSNGVEEHIENFVIEVPVRLGHIYDIAKEVVDQQVKNPETIDIVHLSSFDLAVDVLPYDGTATIYAITDAQSRINGEDFQLFFANKFGHNSRPELSFIPDFILTAGQEFTFTVTATDLDDDFITYSDNSQLFEIDQTTGVITFTPTAQGITSVVIRATDDNGASDNETIQFEIQ